MAAPLDSTSIHQKNADEREKDQVGTRKAYIWTDRGWTLGRTKPASSIPATHKGSPSWRNVLIRLLFSIQILLCYSSLHTQFYFGIQVCPHENLIVIPSADKREGENARTFQKYPRGTKSRAGGKFIWKDIKAGHCSRLYLLLSFIGIHCTFNFQMFERVLLFPARNTVP